MSAKQRRFDLAVRSRPLPPHYGHMIQTECFMRFTFLDRLKILFGYNHMIYVGVACQHKPGRQFSEVHGKLTREVEVDEHLRTIMREKLKRLNAPAEP